MKENKVQIIIAYVYHAVFIVFSFIAMRSDYFGLQVTALIADAVYLVYWIVLNRKGYMPWIVYLHFIIGTILEVVLNYFGIIPEDGGWFAGLAQFFYIVLLLLHAALLGIANFVLWMIHKKRQA